MVLFKKYKRVCKQRLYKYLGTSAGTYVNDDSNCQQ